MQRVQRRKEAREKLANDNVQASNTVERLPRSSNYKTRNGMLVNMNTRPLQY